MDLSEFAGTPNSEKEGVAVNELDVVDSYEGINEFAKKLWESGEAFRYMYKSCESYHKGDKWSIKIMLLTFVDTHVLGSKGMHVGLNGKAGTGKSHLVHTVGKHLPDEYFISGRFSDKSLFHKVGLKPGCIIAIDDQALTEAFEEMFKQVSSDFHSPYQYHSVGKDNKEVVHIIPPETVFWISKAEIVGDEQTQDRQFILNTDDSLEQLETIKDAIIADAMNPAKEADDYTRVVSQAIWQYLPRAYVTIPFADMITTDGDVPEARNLNLLLDLIRTSALIHEPLREKGELIKGNMNVIASFEDYMIASKLMNRLLQGKGGSQKHKIGPKGEQLLKLLATEYTKQPTDIPIPRKELCMKLHMSGTMMSYTLRGRNNRGTDGLESVCPAIEVVPMNNPNHGGQGGSYGGTGILWNYYEYIRWDGRAETYALKKDGELFAPVCTSAVVKDLADDEEEEAMMKAMKEQIESQLQEKKNDSSQ